MNTITKSFSALGFFVSLKKLFNANNDSRLDDLQVYSGHEAILELATAIEDKKVAVVIHLVNGTFFKATIVKVLNGAYLITEASGILSTKANLVSIREIVSISIRG